jgi:type IV secretion system protein VirD4
MTPKKFLDTSIPVVAMIAVCLSLPRIERWLSTFATTDQAELFLGRIGLALPYALAGASGLLLPFGTRGSINVKTAGWSVAVGGLGVIVVAAIREGLRLLAFAGEVPGRTLLSYADPSTIAGACAALLTTFFPLRVARMGNAAFARSEPRRIRGKRALHGEAYWMMMREAEKLFAETGGIVIGERYRVDRDDPAATSFRPDMPTTWGKGGSAPLLCFDGSFGSSHGIVFAGSGGFKTTSSRACAWCARRESRCRPVSLRR